MFCSDQSCSSFLVADVPSGLGSNLAACTQEIQGINTECKWLLLSSSWPDMWG